MKTDFLPPSPDFEGPLMERLYEEACMEETDAPTGFSLKGWVITGFFVLLSLSSSFFGMNFTEIADAEGSSFLLPVGITIGIVLTGYGALFIGSHLKDFFPPSPDFAEPIMERLYEETCMEETDAPTGFSLKGWVIIGFFVLLSLSSSFFSMNFTEIANAEGSSFLLPVGLTIGIVLTGYGALFIGSHLKELSSRFRLR